MNKFISWALLSAGIAFTSSAQSSEFGAAAFSPDIFDAIFNNDSKPTDHTNQKQTSLEPAKNIEREGVKNVHTQSAKKRVQYQVSQIVDDTYIPTTMSAIKKVKTTDCREYKNYRYYFSDKENIIGTDNFSTLTPAQIEKILALPKCKK